MALTLPKLSHHEGSWIVRHKATGKVVYELFKGEESAALNMNGQAYEAIGILEYLQSINGKAKV